MKSIERDILNKVQKNLKTLRYYYQAIMTVNKNSHSCLIKAMLIGLKGFLAICRTFSMSAHSLRANLAATVVRRQKAARVFIMGLGLPALSVMP